MSFLKKVFSKPSPTNPDTHGKELLLEQYSNKVYPWIKVTFQDNDKGDDSTSIVLSDNDSPIYRDWLGDLAIFYAIDMGDNFQLLLKRDLPKNMTEAELHQLAVDNLNRDVEYKLHDTNFGGHGLIAGGDHEAGSICLPEIWTWISDYLNDNLIVAIPSKDMVLVVPESDLDKISNLKIFVYDFFKIGERLLTKNIFRFDKVTNEWTIIDNVA